MTDVTPASMSDDVFEYGLDYLGYWMKKAIANWRDAHNLNVDPPSIDIVAHSMGGLVARSYLQSSAYARGAPQGRSLCFIEFATSWRFKVVESGSRQLDCRPVLQVLSIENA